MQVLIKLLFTKEKKCAKIKKRSKGNYGLMKKLKTILTVVFIISLVGGLWYKNSNKNTFKTTEFLFDTTCTVTAYGSSAKDATKEAFSLIEEIHSLTNYFSDSSDVQRINSSKVGESIKIDKMTADIIKCAIKISEKTDGAFDITIAPLSDLWDFKAENPLIPDDESIKKAKEKVDYTALILDYENCTITKKADVKIDLGAAAKGYACDRAAEIFKEKGISAIIDLGGNIVCTGKNPKTKNGLWRIGLQTPFGATGSFEKIVEIESGSVVTSGIYQRFFEKNGEKFHHIIDPKTGYPKNTEYNATTIVSKSSLLADCLSTACFILGEEDGKKLTKEYDAEIYYY